MSLALTLKTSGEVIPSSGVATTASVTVATGSLVIVAFGMRVASGDLVANVFSVAGLGLTWVRGVERPEGPTLPERGGAFFYAMGTGATGALTITGPASAVDCTYCVVEVTGADQTGANGAGAVNNLSPLDSNVGPCVSVGTEPALTISGSAATGDMTFAIVILEDAEAGETEKAGWTNISKNIGVTDVSHDAMYHTTHDQSPTWAGVRTDGRTWIAMGALLKAPAAAPASSKSFDGKNAHRPAPFKPMGDAFRPGKFSGLR